jgi:hypothetical protein
MSFSLASDSQQSKDVNMQIFLFQPMQITINQGLSKPNLFLYQLNKTKTKDYETN